MKILRCSACFVAVLSSSLGGQAPKELPIPPAVPEVARCDKENSQVTAQRAREALSGADPAMAATLFRRAYEACPSQRNLLLEAAEAYTRKRDFDPAIKSANEFLQLEPNSVAGRLALANALFMAQRWKESGPAIERVLELDPENMTALLLKANNFYLIGESGKAEDTLVRILEKHPNSVEAAYTLGRIYYMDDRGDYAMAQFQRVLKLDPKNYKAWDNLGLCYEAAGDAEMAIRHFLTAIKLVEKDHPEYDWPYANLAELLIKQNDHERAYQAATMAAKRNPYSARNFFLGGKALAKLGRTGDARKWLERSTKLDPNYPDPLYLLGQVYMRLGEKEKAKETLARFREVKAKAPKKRR